jgi:putative membrane protein
MEPGRDVMKELTPGERPLLGALLMAGVLAMWGLPEGPALGNPVPSAAPVARPENGAPVRPSGPTATDRDTLQKLHDANQMEIEMGTLAKQRGSSKLVKQFASRLVADHTAADKKIDVYLRKHGGDIRTLATTAADADHTVLGSKSGVEFDRAFALRMIVDHTKVIDLLEGGRKETGDDDLRAMYEELLPTVQAHKRQAQDIVAGLARS